MTEETGFSQLHRIIGEHNNEYVGLCPEFGLFVKSTTMEKCREKLDSSIKL